MAKFENSLKTFKYGTISRVDLMMIFEVNKNEEACKSLDLQASSFQLK